MAPPSSKPSKRLVVKITYTKRKENQQQLDDELELLNKFDAVASALNNKTYDKLKAAI